MAKAAFLDRDGVINHDHGYVHRVDDFDFIPGVFTACRQLLELDYRLIIVTNQAGIGRGYYTEADFQALTEWMRQQFLKEGVEITAVYHCPFHPEAKLSEYRQVSPYRKPGPQMLLDAAQQHKVDLRASFVVGDKPSDIAAGRAAGVERCYFIGDAARLTTDYPEYKAVPAYASLLELVQAEFSHI